MFFLTGAQSCNGVMLITCLLLHTDPSNRVKTARESSSRPRSVYEGYVNTILVTVNDVSPALNPESSDIMQSFRLRHVLSSTV